MAQEPSVFPGAFVLENTDSAQGAGNRFSPGGVYCREIIHDHLRRFSRMQSFLYYSKLHRGERICLHYRQALATTAGKIILSQAQPHCGT